VSIPADQSRSIASCSVVSALWAAAVAVPVAVGAAVRLVAGSAVEVGPVEPVEPVGPVDVVGAGAVAPVVVLAL
jgi:hypothetical protein